MHHWIQSFRGPSVAQVKIFPAKAQIRKGRFDCLLCAFAGITLFVHWFAHGVEDIDLAPRERAPVEVDDQRVESD